MQSLVEQWRLQLAAQDESFGVSGAPTETLKPKSLKHISDEVVVDIGTFDSTNGHFIHAGLLNGDRNIYLSDEVVSPLC